MSNTEDQINRLNAMVKLRIAPSPIHGVGIFAIRDLVKGEKLWATEFPRPYKISPSNLDKLFPEVKQLILERNCRAVLGEAFMYPDMNHQAYTNHSDEPNYDCQLDMALRDIKGGEEITENYKQIPGWDKVFPFLVV